MSIIPRPYLWQMPFSLFWLRKHLRQVLSCKVLHTCLTYVEANIVRVSTQSNLAIVPSASMPAYCSSKAALNTFAMCLRAQLKKVRSNVTVIEVFPPAVQSKLWSHYYFLRLALQLYRDMLMGMCSGATRLPRTWKGPPNGNTLARIHGKGLAGAF
jgi:NAD(P)-dependent dehydrogenase (short-subunit alcohol dehydrogenase family)